MNAQQHRVPVAVRRGGNYLQSIAGAFSLGPQFLASAAVEGHEAGAEGPIERFTIHKAEHEHFSVFRVLNDGGGQALHLVEINLHRNSPNLIESRQQAFRTRQKKQKARWASSAPAGLDSYDCLVIRVPPPTRSSHGDGGDDDESTESLQSRY